ncbi:hypothetical protein [Methylobacterium oxalidis]|uniref:Uncharacterized protein n=1 Tax=Methylobacterium oxalidis TaxID=944322 RepID=A0A512J5S4_9HYPH|nr:hypothetical protein [Methylobacterium oxalidis]GEP05305.1 hypothetical protein MOX02_33430 [Methylobacterium oxalidis]GJE30007.1 hypothetical protein LDDCCGHA_0170 [Methylobacterium oxalidis]GLS64651.1 hypothetical protein GCM10007888_30320 [Methylobacterium oxalidis]
MISVDVSATKITQKVTDAAIKSGEALTVYEAERLAETTPGSASVLMSRAKKMYDPEMGCDGLSLKRSGSFVQA